MKKIEILVVDDSASIRQFMREILKQMDAHVTEAENGIEAHKLISQNAYDLIFMDIAMPGKSGLDVVERVRNHLGYKYTPIIMMTALDQTDLIKKAFDIGASDYITKPLSEIEVIARSKVRLENRRLNRALADANKAKSDFISHLAHELKNPLNAMKGYAQLVELNIDDKENVLEFCENIIIAGDHQESLINEVTNLAKIEAGIIDIKLENIKLAKVIKEAFDLTGPMRINFNVSFEYPRLSEVDYTVKADKKRLKQVLVNLISNAIKYNKPNGTVTISVKEISDSRLKVGIADNGKGIEPDNFQKIFEPFNRIGAENTEVEGTGIGLPITKKIIELMDGEIEVESELGKGSTFWFSLPYVKPE